MSDRRWVVLGLVFFGILISYVDRGNLSIAAPAIMRDFNVPPQTMGVLLSAFFWTYATFQIPAGLIVDRFGIRLTYAAAFVTWSLASAGTAIAHGAGGVLGLRLLLGLAESVGPLASLAFIRRNFSGAEQGLPTGIYIGGQTVGPAFGALVGSVLLADFGWRAMFAFTGLGALLWVPFWLYCAPRRLAQPDARQHSPNAPLPWPWQVILSSPAFWAMSFCVLFFSYYWYFLLTWIPAYLTMQRGLSTIGMGRILSAPLFAMAVVNVITGSIADRIISKTEAVFRVRLLFAAAGLVGASVILLLNVLPGHAPVLPILAVSVCSFGVTSSNYWAISQYAAPRDKVGTAIGYLNTLSQIGGITAPLVTGWSLGPHKDFTFAIVLAGIAPLISCILLFVAGPNGLAKLKKDLSPLSA